MKSQNVIFWGAGATAALGMRTTAGQTKCIRIISGADTKQGEPLPTRERTIKALGKVGEPWVGALSDLITILGDRKENYDRINDISPEEREAMRRNWTPVARDENLDDRIIFLRLHYDWPALKALVRICPGSSGDKFKLNDLFNVLDLHAPLGFGVRAPTLSPGNEQFFDARRLIGAKNALRMLLGAFFYIDYQMCITSKVKELNQYLEFANYLGRRMQRQGKEIACHGKFDQPEFYRGDVDFVSLNYDPIALWVQFMANRELNNSPSVPHIGNPATPIQIFHDYGHLIPARRIGKGKLDCPWYPMNEGIAQRLNELDKGASRVRLTKFLFPHGCLCWRECPDCGKLSCYHGDQWELTASRLVPPPPLLAFDREACPDDIPEKEREQREWGIVDARACLHCQTMTYAHHTQSVMQSSFKSQPPSFIDEIQRDLRAVAMKANHIIFMGYSLPPDDVTYRAFFSARRQRQLEENNEENTVRCTIVGWEAKYPGWYGPQELRTMKFMQDGVVVSEHAVDSARAIFGDDNVRFYGGGIPNVFLEQGVVTSAAIERLLNWS